MKSEANIAPKYLNLFMLSDLRSKIERDNEEIVNNYLLLPINMDLVLESFKVSLFTFSHNATSQRSAFNLLYSSRGSFAKR